jgi:hypothetical protein
MEVGRKYWPIEIKYLKRQNKPIQKKAHPEKWSGKIRDWHGLKPAKVISKKLITEKEIIQNNIKLIA